MVIQMTREEYQKKYGVSTPTSKSVTESFDTTPAPIMMTREEYDAKYRPTPTKQQATQDYVKSKLRMPEKTDNFYTKTFEAGKAGVNKIVSGVEQIKESPSQSTTLGSIGKAGRGLLNVAGGALETVYSPVAGIIGQAQELPVVNETINWSNPESILSKNVTTPLSQVGTDNKYYQYVADKVPQDVAENLINIGIFLFGGKNAKGVKPAIESTVNTTGRIIDAEIKPRVEQIKTQVIEPVKQAVYDRGVNNLANEIANVENNYAPIRKANKFESDEGQASRIRIAEAHKKSGILNGIVDVDGRINTNKAVKAYRNETISGAEGTVRQNLVREGKTVNIEEIRRDLINAVDDVFEGANLTTAINGINKEINGLKSRADEFGNIPLAKVQDFKIATTENINYKKDNNAKIKYEKAKASTYRKIIENKSDVQVVVDGKTYRIEDINGELAKYYTDIERLQALDGRKVKGGRLGKYVAQALGTGIGGAAGSILGPAGATVGGVIGGEAASFLKGQEFTRTFGQGGEGVIPRNPILDAAVKEGKLPPTIDLKVADVRVGAGKNIPKTKEVLLLENKIKKNVEAQKSAIKAGDFDLVATLKVVYQNLVQSLKDLIKKIKETPNKKGGMIKNPLYEYNLGKRKTQYNNTATKNKTVIDKVSNEMDNLSTTLKTKNAVVFKDIQGNKVSIPAGTVIKAGEKGSNMVISVKGEPSVMTKNQFQNLKAQSSMAEAKEFAPELKGTEETVKSQSSITQNDIYRRFDNGEITREERNSLLDKLGTDKTKYAQYQLPDGKNYKEILIKAPETLKKGDYGTDVIDKSKTFRSSHWEEPNVISHLRMNERTYNGKKVSFMEELQSDWAREGRSKGFANPNIKEPQLPEGWRVIDNGDTYQVVDKNGNRVPDKLMDNDFAYGGNRDIAIARATGDESFIKSKIGVPNHPLLKNWQVPTIKRALKEAVDSNADYFAWINGDQTSARYSLATQVDTVKWESNKAGWEGKKQIYVNAKSGRDIIIKTDEKGNILKGQSVPSDWKGKKLDEVLGKGLADKIMADESGTLAGDGLKFGGEWANNLYDKQVKSIVEDLTGAKVKEMDLGLPIEKSSESTGSLALKMYGKPFDELNSAEQKTIRLELEQPKTIQQGIELTPDIKSRIKGEKPNWEAGKISNKALLGLGLGIGIPLLLSYLMKDEESKKEEEVKDPFTDTANTIKKGLLYVENRGDYEMGKNVYETVNKRTGDVGKYQTNPATLKDWAKHWLNKPYTVEEYKKDPQAQEKFMENFLAVVKRYGLTQEEAAIAWHTGWGAVGFKSKTFEEKKRDLMQNIKNSRNDPEVVKYINTFNIGVTK